MTPTFRIEDGCLWVGNTPYPDAAVFTQDVELDKIILRERRARLCFDNGWQLSLIWGSASYSVNQFETGDGFEETPTSAEAMVIPPDPPDLPSEDSIFGHLSVDDVNDLITTLSGKPSSTTVVEDLPDYEPNPSKDWM